MSDMAKQGNYCVNCAHYRYKDVKGKDPHWCAGEAWGGGLDPVTGEEVLADCRERRAEGSTCGVAGAQFVGKGEH